jgi:hypothetical protein
MDRDTQRGVIHIFGPIPAVALVILGFALFWTVASLNESRQELGELRAQVESLKSRVVAIELRSQIGEMKKEAAAAAK